MISLRERQHSFMKALIGGEDGDDGALPDGFQAGLQVYRNNYRSALIDAMEETFLRTARLTGSEAFRRAAIHHVIAHPPSSWTIDAVGEGFPATCRELFACDPDVAEIAWLEWSMSQAFVAASFEPLTIEQFGQATASYDDEQWACLRLSFAPGLALGSAAFDLPRLWQSLAIEDARPDVIGLNKTLTVKVWREDETPVFAVMAEDEAHALRLMMNGARFGEICEMVESQESASDAPGRAGEILRRWFDDKHIVGAH